jgi:hypothetical protein
MDILLLKLLIAHLLGDFFFQSDNWVKEKELRKIQSPKLYLHILVHGVLMFLLVWDLDFWPSILILMLSHGLIDAIKLVFQQRSTKRVWFFADQLLHLISIVLVWYFAARPLLDFSFLNKPAFLATLAAILFLTFPASIIIKVLITKWTPNNVDPHINVKETSLQSAGKYIGIMERLLVFTFILTNHFEAVGFLIAAKSIFRFGDLKDGNDLKLTEYILIGTFLSFGFAVLIALIISGLS